MTLRIKSPLRSAEDISRCGASRWGFSLSAERRHFGLCKSKSVKHRIVFLRAHCGTRRITGTLQHASMWTISSSLGYFPMQRALKFSLLPPPRPSFSRRRLCNYGGLFILPMILPKRSFCLRGSHLEPYWHEAQGENKKDPYSHKWTNNGNTKKRTVLFA